jgi:hypothetical protein
VVAELGRQTGVRMTTAPEVMNEPAIVYVTQQPAGSVMTHLAGLFGCRWDHSGAEGKESYRLVQEPAAKKEEQRLQREDRSRAFEAVRAELMKRARPAPDGTLHRPYSALARLVQGMGAAELDRIRSGDAVYYTSHGERETLPLPPALVPDLAPLRSDAQESWKKMAGVRLSVCFAMPVPYNPTLLRFQETAAFPPGVVPPRPDLGYYLISVNYRRPVPTRPPLSEVQRACSEDPILGKRAQLAWNPPAGKTPRLFDLLPQIAETYGVNLIADGYWVPSEIQGRTLKEEDLPLYQVLHTYVQPSSRWSREGEFIHVRSHTSYFDRLAEIPSRLLDYWLVRLRQSSQLSLDDAAMLTLSLRDEQLDYFPLVLRDHGVYLDSFYQYVVLKGGKEILRAYGNLTAAQRQALHAGEAIPYEALSPAARDWLRRAYDWRHTYYAMHSPPGGHRTGALSLEVDRVRRVVTDTSDSRINYAYEKLDGPDAGKRVATGFIPRIFATPETVNPGAPPVFQYVNFRHFYNDTDSEWFSLSLPTIYVQPAGPAEGPR